VVEDPLAAFLPGLDLLPALAHAAGRLRYGLPEHVWVPPHQLRVDGPGRVLEASLALLGQEQRQEVHLEEQVAELVEQLLGAARERRVGDLVGLLDRVRNDARDRLLAVPRAVAAQPFGEPLQLDEGLGEAVLGGRYCDDAVVVVFGGW
jgi:hypothetical protein